MKKHYILAFIMSMFLHGSSIQGAATVTSPAEEYWQNVVEPALEKNQAPLMNLYDYHEHETGNKSLLEILLEHDSAWESTKNIIKEIAQYTDFDDEFTPEIRELLSEYTKLLAKEGKTKNLQEEQLKAEEKRRKRAQKKRRQEFFCGDEDYYQEYED